MTHPLAQIAVKAAEYSPRWGSYASARYALNRGVPLRLYLLALQLSRGG